MSVSSHRCVPCLPLRSVAQVGSGGVWISQASGAAVFASGRALPHYPRVSSEPFVSLSGLKSGATPWRVRASCRVPRHGQRSASQTKPRQHVGEKIILIITTWEVKPSSLWCMRDTPVCLNISFTSLIYHCK